MNLQLTLRTLFIFVLFYGINSSAKAQSPKFVNEFLNIGVGAEAHGMFGSVAASVDDVTAGYWNPAGLANIEDPLQLSAMHASWFGGISNYDYIGAAKQLNGSNNSVASISLIRMGVDDIPNTLNLVGPDGSINYDNVTTFSAADYAFLASYARKISFLNLNVGGTAKVIHRRIGPFGSAWGFGFDAGVQYRNDGLMIGIMARDITTTVNAWSFNLTPDEEAIFVATGNDIPVSSTEVALPKLVLAGAYEGKIKDFSYLVEADFRFTTDGTQAGVLSGNRFGVDPSFGIQAGYDEMVFLRFGLGNMQNIINEINTSNTRFTFQPNVGLGVKLGRLSVDYALTNIGTVSEVLVSHVFSLQLRFN